MQTQCPQCHTAFRVSAEQLELAAGRVRCGQCLHVFVASEHFIDAPLTNGDTPTPSTEADFTFEDNGFDMPAELFTEELTPVEIEVAEIDMPVLDELDAYVEEADGETAATLEPSSAVNQHDDIGANVPAQGPLIQSISSHLPAANEVWQEPDSATEIGLEADTTIETRTEDEGPSLEIVASGEKAPDEEQALTSVQNEGIPDKTIPLLVETYDPSQLYPELGAAPVVERPQHTGLYSLAIIALLAGFLLQGTYALRDTLAKQPALRPLMSDFCATFDCALTLPREPDKVLLTRSEVRSHPAQNGVLLVKAGIKNQARFRQAYPILRLQFSDLDGKPLIGRDFMPEQYLPGDVNIKAGMPVNADINLSLELVDPGSQAVSFDFALL